MFASAEHEKVLSKNKQEIFFCENKPELRVEASKVVSKK